jgi:hypothetical protein
MKPGIYAPGVTPLGRMADLVDNPQRAVSTVEELTGRPGTTFADWAAEHIEIFR